MKVRFVVLLVLAGLLVACADAPIKQSAPFKLSGRNHLYNKAKWEFTGRLAFSDKNNSLSASISWRHLYKYDEVELSGPFGQGRTIIQITGNKVVVDYGGEQVQFNGLVNDLMAKYTGVSVPILALKYWVLGLVDPENTYESIEDGFMQSGWRLNYQQMQIIGRDEMPRKIRVKQDDSRLKLIIDHWDI